jgi:hypothetical protein
MLISNTSPVRPRTAAKPFEARSYDGTGNNLDRVELGSANTPFGRLSPSAYGDGISRPSGAERPSPRTISNIVADQPTGVKSASDLSGMVWLWGQFLDHDITLTPNGHRPDFNIAVPAGDPYFDPQGTGGKTLPFARSLAAPGTGEAGPREQINAITSWIDGSMIYGSDKARADALRSFQAGKLRTSAGDFLPYNTLGLPNENPTRRPPETLFLAGDVRANENVALTSLHTVFLREHNRLAEHLAKENPQLDDEQIYQRARKIVGAQIQAVTYNEFLPALLGQDAVPEYQGHSAVDPTISNEFATAAYRLGHTMIENKIWRNEVNGDEVPEKDLEIKDAFFAPEKLKEAGGLEPILRGTADFRQEEIDHKIVHGLRNFLFGKPGEGGLDLAALNIQRGRDHGLPDYNTLRAAVGASKVESFAQITSDPEKQSKMAQAYQHVDQIDPWVGLIVEDHLPGTSVGPTMKKILVDQFSRLRDGDRFFYKNDPDLQDHLAEIEATSLTDIIRRNTDVGAEMADDSFRAFRSGRPETTLG